MAAGRGDCGGRGAECILANRSVLIVLKCDTVLLRGLDQCAIPNLGVIDRYGASVKLCLTVVSLFLHFFSLAHSVAFLPSFTLLSVDGGVSVVLLRCVNNAKCPLPLESNYQQQILSPRPTLLMTTIACNF